MAADLDPGAVRPHAVGVVPRRSRATGCAALRWQGSRGRPPGRRHASPAPPPCFRQPSRSRVLLPCVPSLWLRLARPAFPRRKPPQSYQSSTPKPAVHRDQHHTSLSIVKGRGHHPHLASCLESFPADHPKCPSPPRPFRHEIFAPPSAHLLDRREPRPPRAPSSVSRLPEVPLWVVGETHARCLPWREKIPGAVFTFLSQRYARPSIRPGLPVLHPRRRRSRPSRRHLPGPRSAPSASAPARRAPRSSRHRP